MTQIFESFIHLKTNIVCGIFDFIKLNDTQFHHYLMMSLIDIHF